MNCRIKAWMLSLLLVLLLPVGAGADIIINEVMASNGTYKNGNAYDWIELYNNGSETVNLSGWHLSDSKKDPEKFTFPSGTKLKKDSYLIVYCTDEADTKTSKTTLYADFNISASGETLRLTNKDGEEVQTLKLPKQYGNISYGLANGGTEYGFFEKSTPGKKNSATVCQERVEDPSFDTYGGYYSHAVTVTIACPAGATLYYTTDGSTPTESSKLYPEDGITVDKTMPIRVKAFEEGKLSSNTITCSYILEDTQITPIVCLTTDDKYFNSSSLGIFKNTDKDYQYACNIEYYNMDSVCELNQVGTVRLQGYSSRSNKQKSMTLSARKSLGGELFEFNPFPTRDYDGYKTLLLRGANSDSHTTRLRDVVATSLMEGQGVLYQDSVVIQVYINGKYWGHYNLREKINKYMIAQYEGVTDEALIDQIDIIDRTGTSGYVLNGSGEDWIELANFCRDNDLNDPDNLAWVEERLDIDNLFTFALCEMIIGNVDVTNHRLYRVPGGKWKYILHDIEACWRNADEVPISSFIRDVKTNLKAFRHEPLNALLKVPEYRDKFLRRAAELLETCFTWPVVEAKFNAVTDILEQILPRHIAKFGTFTMSNWRTNVGAVKYYARVRAKKFPSMLKTAMKLTNAEYEEYFGEVNALLEVTNAKPE